MKNIVITANKIDNEITSYSVYLTKQNNEINSKYIVDDQSVLLVSDVTLSKAQKYCDELVFINRKKHEYLDQKVKYIREIFEKNNTDENSIDSPLYYNPFHVNYVKLEKIESLILFDCNIFGFHFIEEQIGDNFNNSYIIIRSNKIDLLIDIRDIRRVSIFKILDFNDIIYVEKERNKIFDNNFVDENVEKFDNNVSFENYCINVSNGSLLHITDKDSKTLLRILNDSISINFNITAPNSITIPKEVYERIKKYIYNQKMIKTNKNYHYTFSH